MKGFVVKEMIEGSQACGSRVISEDTLTLILTQTLKERRTNGSTAICTQQREDYLHMHTYNITWGMKINQHIFNLFFLFFLFPFS